MITGYNLDEEQSLAIEHPTSKIIIAGPGSGKTRILTANADYLLSKGQNVICICFTRTAAKEMTTRVKNLPATTIHSFCCAEVGWDKEWGYDGLLYRFLMQKDKPKFDWVFVDEVQDINPKEFDVILSIAKENIFAVGDPYQSIYGFQGALGFRVFDYLKKFGCKEFLLRNNYRSVPEVVNKLNKIYDRKLVSTGVKDNKTNALLFRKNDDLFYVSGVLKTKRVPHIVNLSKSFGEYSEYSVNGDSKLKLMTIHSSKGKEFDNVGIYDFFPFLNGSSPEEERVYYVGCSRASKSYTPLTTMSEVLNFAKANV